MKKILLILIFEIFLSSCRSVPESFVADQCQTVLALDSYGEIDADKSFCRCRDYMISKEFIGSRGKVVRKKLIECHEVLGFSVKNNTKLVNFYEHVRSEINESEIELGQVGQFQEGIAREIKKPVVSGGSEW